MSSVVIYAIAGIGLIGAGTFGICRDADPLRRIMAINVAAVGVLTVMVSLAARGPGPADPVTHAMVLTGLVVSASATALALTLVRRIARSQDAGAGHDR
jgi:multicomponent Na+:H+ antiporter subunit C